jgi:hypothetical protein
MRNPEFVKALDEVRLKFPEILEEILELHERKNANYAGAAAVDPLWNFILSEELTGVPAYLGVMVRMVDKWSRIKNLSKGEPDKVGESLRDTLVDLSVYSLIAVLLLDRVK